MNIRATPSTSAPVRHYGLGGDRVNILNQTNAPDGYRWYFVEFPNSGARGWIRADLLRVGGNYGGSSTQRIAFAPGTSAATVGGKVQGAQSRDYLVNARAGQTLNLSTVGTSSFLQLQVFAPNGSTLYTGSRNWSSVLRQSGDYRVRARLVPEEQKRGVTAEYSLTVSVR
ncbi:SH3 domain-containing protein [Phormidium sp. CLA17]|uniref:SH3 domain-containing protein n=1 Tax=Leptolyngbya sp. Cla-17 TaxID=2803751 RepID=UPI00193423B4|nr:SH3 domain-containing protein [Leptolyngbya sp. Cla-17]MBM0745478.1 SH3 domain-containing protein [Leptolyngbya sp. Cla-17]